MPTNFKLTREKAVHDTPKHYVVEREVKAVERKVESVAQELKSHKKTSMDKAHPKKQVVDRRSHKAEFCIRTTQISLNTKGANPYYGYQQIYFTHKPRFFSSIRVFI